MSTFFLIQHKYHDKQTHKRKLNFTRIPGVVGRRKVCRSVIFFKLLFKLRSERTKLLQYGIQFSVLWIYYETRIINRAMRSSINKVLGLDLCRRQAVPPQTHIRFIEIRLWSRRDTKTCRHHIKQFDCRRPIWKINRNPHSTEFSIETKQYFKTYRLPNSLLSHSSLSESTRPKEWETDNAIHGRLQVLFCDQINNFCCLGKKQNRRSAEEELNRKLEREGESVFTF